MSNFRARVPADEWPRVEELDARSEDRTLDVAEREHAAVEGHHLLWPHYFAKPASAGPDYLDRIGIEHRAGSWPPAARSDEVHNTSDKVIMASKP